MSGIQVKEIKPCTEEHDQIYGFFVVADQADANRELGAFCYHVPGISSKMACEAYPAREVACRMARLFKAAVEADGIGFQECTQAMCPHPAGGKPAGLTADACNAAGECGCCYKTGAA